MTLKIFSNRQWKEFIEIYRWSLRQRLGMMILYLALLFMALPLILLIVIANTEQKAIVLNITTGKQEDYLSQTFSGTLHILLPALVMPLTLLFALILAVMLFNYLHQKRSTDYFHSVPVGRTPLLLGKYFAGLTMIFIPLIINLGIVAIIIGVNNFGATVPVVSILYDLLWAMLMVAAAFSFTVLMAVCSGTTMDMVVSTIVINIAYPIMIILSQYIARSILPGLGISSKVITNTSTVAFAPFAAAFFPFIPTRLFGFSMLTTPFTIWWILFTLVLFAASIILYHKRKSESAENTFAFPLPKIIIRFVVTAAAGLGLGMILYSGSNQNNFNFFLGVFTGSLAAHIIIEAIYSRGFKGLKKSLKYYGAFVMLFLIAYIPLSYGFFGYDTRVPATADVASVEVYLPYYSSAYYSTATQVADEHGNQLAVIAGQLSSSQNIDKIRTLQQNLISSCKQNSYPYKINTNAYQQINMVYHLKNGHTLSRTYYSTVCGGYTGKELFTEDLQKLAFEIQGSDEYKAGYLINYLEPSYIDKANIFGGNSSYTLESGDDIKLELINALKQDIQETNPSTADEEAFRIDLEFKDSFVPSAGSPLKKLIGNYSGKVHFNNSPYFSVPKSFVHTTKLVKKYGWIK